MENEQHSDYSDTNSQSDDQTSNQSREQSNDQSNEQVIERIDEQSNDQSNEQLNEQVIEQTVEQVIEQQSKTDSGQIIGQPITKFVHKPFFNHTEDIRPSKLKHIKNTIMLDNTINPLNNKYIKKIWVYKVTKLDRIKRDLFWEYFKDRKRHTIAETLLKAYYKNRKDTTIIYFDDPVQYDITITDEMATELKKVNRDHIAFIKSITPIKPKKIKIKKEKKPKKPHYKSVQKKAKQ